MVASLFSTIMLSDWICFDCDFKVSDLNLAGQDERMQATSA